MNKNKILFTLALIISIIGFGQQTTSVIHESEVLEVIQVKSYTYLRLVEDNTEKWLAVPTIVAEVGEIYFYKGGMEMPSFKSNELNRTFESVIFLQTISKNKEDLEVKPFKHNVSVLEKKSTNKSKEKLEITIENVEGVISIEELMKNASLYKDQVVKVKGQVTKFSSQIMSKNWIHLQDGTDFNNEFDLTLTTNAEVSVGDIVIFEGKVSLDKDFGAGYFYKIIMENAVFIK